MPEENGRTAGVVDTTATLLLTLTDTAVYIRDTTITRQPAKQNETPAGVYIRESHPHPPCSIFVNLTAVTWDADAEINVNIPTATSLPFNTIDNAVSKENDAPAATRQLPSQIGPEDAKETVITTRQVKELWKMGAQPVANIK